MKIADIKAKVKKEATSVKEKTAKFWHDHSEDILKGVLVVGMAAIYGSTARYMYICGTAIKEGVTFE